MIKIFNSIEELNLFAAEKISRIAEISINSKGKFTFALAGGSTPKALYQLLASDKFKNEINWSKTFFFFGDERNAPPDSKESNFQMANENLFAPLKIADGNIFRWKTELKQAEKIAHSYEEELKRFFRLKEDELPRFDLMLLGMGNDGHTASLFPFTEALQETRKIAVANRVEKLAATRLTLTFPAINNAENLIFLVNGNEKSEILREVLHGDFDSEKLPAQKVKLIDGNLFWLLDRAASRLLQ